MSARQARALEVLVDHAIDAARQPIPEERVLRLSPAEFDTIRAADPAEVDRLAAQHLDAGEHQWPSVRLEVVWPMRHAEVGR